MNLLDKKLVSAEVATQRKQQIDLGVSLAKKVDAVKETLQQEETRLESFRLESVARVKVEIDKLLSQKQILKGEIDVLLRDKANAQIPLDVEWEKITYATSKLQKDRDAWGEKSDLLSQRRNEIERREAETLSNKERATELLRVSSEKYVESEEALTEAREFSKKLREEAGAILSSAESRLKLVELKEDGLRMREEEVDRVWEKVRMKEVNVANRERVLRDRYQELETTIKRLSK